MVAFGDPSPARTADVDSGLRPLHLAYSGQNSTPWNTLAFVGLRDWIDQTLKWSQIAEVMAGNGYVKRITLEYPVVSPMPPKAFVSLKIRPFVQ